MVNPKLELLSKNKLGKQQVNCQNKNVVFVIFNAFNN